MTGLEAKFIRREHDAGETLGNIVGNIEETSAVGQLTVGTINTPPFCIQKRLPTAFFAKNANSANSFKMLVLLAQAPTK